MITAITLAAMMTVPVMPPPVRYWTGPALACTQTFSFELREGESANRYQNGFVVQSEIGEVRFSSLVRSASPNMQEPEVIETYSFPGGRYVFDVYEINNRRRLGFVGDTHPMIYRVGIRFETPEAYLRADDILLRIGRLPIDPAVCTAPSFSK